MGSRIAQILAFTRRTNRHGAKVSDVKVDAGGGNNRTAEHFDGPGADAFPLTTDWVTASDVEGTGRESVLGYLDPINTPKAAKGERRIYGRDPSDGAEVCTVWAKNDGTVVISNENGTFELSPGGTVTINGVTIDPSGNITSPTTIKGLNLEGTASVKAAGKDLAGHTHAITGGSSAPGPTGTNN